MGDQRQRADRTGVQVVGKRSIQINFLFRGIRCRERFNLEPTPANLRRVANHRGAILDAIERGTFDYAATFPDSPRRFRFSAQKGDGYSLEAYLDTWLERQRQHLKASTFSGYRKIVAGHLVPAFGRTFLPDIKRADIRAWCDKQASGNKTLSNVQSVLSKALQDAVDDDLIEVNPLFGWHYSRQEAPKPRDDVDPFSAEEQAAILAHCNEPQVRNLIQFAFWSGLRTSELCALEWGDIDWIRGEIRVSRAKTQASKETEGTKTRRGTRDVKILAPAQLALEAQMPHTYLAGGHVFHDPKTGEPWKGDQPIRKRGWTLALRLAGVRYRRPYQTRHTYGSMMVSAGEPIAWVAAQMGHADLTMISRVYGRWMPDAAPDAGSKAVEAFSPKTQDSIFIGERREGQTL